MQQAKQEDLQFIEDKNFNSLMESQNQTQRKTYMTNIIHEFIVKHQLLKTASVLKKEAMLLDLEGQIGDEENSQPDEVERRRKSSRSNQTQMDMFLKEIELSQALTEQEKIYKIKVQLEKQYYLHVKKNNYDNALNILTQKMPVYFDQNAIQKFAEDLLPYPTNDTSMKSQSEEQKELFLEKMFRVYFDEQEIMAVKLPNWREKIYNAKKQIWFVKYGGKYIIAVSECRKGYLFDNELRLLQQKAEMHSSMISTVEWRNQNEFASSSESGEIKFWNNKLETVLAIKNHKNLINSLVFCRLELNQQPKQFLISGGHDKFFTKTQFTSNGVISRKIRVQCLLIRAIVFYKKKKSLLILTEKDKQVSTVKIFNMETSKWTGQVDVGKNKEQSFFTLELNQKENVFYVMSQKGQIFHYSLKTLEKVGIYNMGPAKGIFVIRMELGGPNNQYLATGSQAGQVLLFQKKKIHPTATLKTEQKTIVNCVSWVNESTLVCGCDSGDIELWSNKDQNQDKLEK